MDILRVAIPLPLRTTYFYRPLDPNDLSPYQPGVRVKVPLGRRTVIGVVLSIENNPELPCHPSKLKSIEEILDTHSLIDPQQLILCQRAADYYHHPLGEVIEALFPTLLRQGKSLPTLIAPTASSSRILKENPLPLNTEQQTALNALQKAFHHFEIFLLQGITGSGKTEVYLQAIQAILETQKTALVLIPEISLTPQTLARFSARFSVPIVTLHSGLSAKKRLESWASAQKGIAQIIIGTRSAVFMPLPNLGLIIVDEEHDLSYKQQEGFRYHARDLAILRAQNANIPVILGSGTPTLETLYKATQKRFTPLLLSQRAGNATLPSFHLIDLRNQTMKEGLSPILLNTMQKHLDADEHVLLFLNRRGFAPIWLCHHCGAYVICHRCEKPMTYHQTKNRLYCHHCDQQRATNHPCHQCHAQHFVPIGMGTERLEHALHDAFPDTPLLRIDRDTTRRKGDLTRLLDEMNQHRSAILIGTQMLAKGHHFPNLTLVGIIDADQGLFNTDFRALEHMGQLLFQVGGRAGRAEKPGTVLLQTHHPHHPIWQPLLQQDYAAFSEQLLLERKACHLPPYTFLSLFRAEAHQKNHAIQFLQDIKMLPVSLPESVHWKGPFFSPMPLRAGRFRAQLILEGVHRRVLHDFLTTILPHIHKLPTRKTVKWSLDVDPVEMI